MIELKKGGKPKYSAINNLIFLLKDMAKKYPLLIFFILLEGTLSVISPVFGIYLPKFTLDLVTNSAPASRVLLLLGGLGLTNTILRGISGMASQGKYLMYNNMRTVYHQRLFIQSIHCDYSHVESPEGQSKYGRAVSSIDSGDWSGTSKMTVAAISIFVNVLCFIIYSGIMSNLSILVVIFLVVLSLISLFQVKGAQKYEYSQQEDMAKVNKKINYIEWTSKDSSFGKDMRLYHAGKWFTSLSSVLIHAKAVISKRVQKRYFMSGAVNSFMLLLRDGVAYAYLIYAVSANKITIGDFALYFGAITAFSGFVGGIVDGLNEINGANLQMNDMRAFLDNTDSPEPENPASLSDIKEFTIEFKEVCFSYENDENCILDHLNLKINNGEKVALVGINGAGKTTIVKLLCGFYKCVSGEILIGGINISRFRHADLLTLFSAVFQDIYIPPFTVAQNVALDTDLDDSKMARVEKCLKEVGLYERILQEPKGLNAVMGKEMDENGLLLSGGQNQKLLMARAIYKNAPILILDEPTAALDPIAESQTYESFHELSSNKTAIYISHRLASTQFCDKIAFLSGGRITELGQHRELVEQGAEYAEMYELQSHYYKEGEAEVCEA